MNTSEILRPLYKGGKTIKVDATAHSAYRFMQRAADFGAGPEGALATAKNIADAIAVCRFTETAQTAADAAAQRVSVLVKTEDGRELTVVLSVGRQTPTAQHVTIVTCYFAREATREFMAEDEFRTRYASFTARLMSALSA